MSSTPVTDNALSRPAGLVVSLRLLAAIVIFAAIAPGILMTAPAVAAQPEIVNGNTTHVHADFPGMDRFKFLFLARQCIKN
ncbi:hypothetical protein CGQ19_25310, partial [Klebsiella quasipneumoniae]